MFHSTARMRTAGRQTSSSSNSGSPGENESSHRARHSSVERVKEEEEEESEEKESGSAACRVRQQSEGRMRCTEMEGVFSNGKEHCLRGEGSPGTIASSSEKIGSVQLSCWGEVMKTRFNVHPPEK